jgi:predicted alpha/beta superfamily hydrolase
MGYIVCLRCGNVLKNTNKTVLYAALVLAFLFSSCKKEEPAPEVIKVSMASDFGSDFELRIVLPDTYSPLKTYGLIFFPDAEWLMKESLSVLKRTTYSEEYIVVGLAYAGANNRTNDYTPTATQPGTGKASHLAGFIEKEIFQEYLAGHYPNLSSDLQKHIFIGHSLGGLFGAYLFLKQKSLFGRYLLISGSYMTDAQSIFSIEREERSSASAQQARIYFGTGSLEEGGFHATVQHFTHILSEHYAGVSYKSEVFNNADHTGVRVKALEGGLPYLLEP